MSSVDNWRAAAAPPIRATRRSLTLDRLTPVVEQAQPDQRLQNNSPLMKSSFI
jgi:hypothetical protein